MLQALVVISLEHNSKRLVSWILESRFPIPWFQRMKVEENLYGYSKYQVTKAMLLSRYYHRLARQIDTFCKVGLRILEPRFLNSSGNVSGDIPSIPDVLLVCDNSRR